MRQVVDHKSEVGHAIRELQNLGDDSRVWIGAFQQRDEILCQRIRRPDKLLPRKAGLNLKTQLS